MSALQTEADYRRRVTAFYQYYAPDRVRAVDSSLAKYQGQEEDLIAALVTKYGPEPGPDGIPPPLAARPVLREGSPAPIPPHAHGQPGGMPMTAAPSGVYSQQQQQQYPPGAIAPAASAAGFPPGQPVSATSFPGQPVSAVSFHQGQQQPSPAGGASQSHFHQPTPPQRQLSSNQFDRYGSFFGSPMQSMVFDAQQQPQQQPPPSPPVDEFASVRKLAKETQFLTSEHERRWEEAWLGKLPMSIILKHALGEQPPLMEGMAHKKSSHPKLFGKKFLKRYLVLIPYFLYYFDSDDPNATCRGALYMDGATIGETESDGKTCIEIVSRVHQKPASLDPSGSYDSFKFHFESERVQEKWLQILSEVSKVKSTPATAASQASPQRAASMTVGPGGVSALPLSQSLIPPAIESGASTPLQSPLSAPPAAQEQQQQQLPSSPRQAGATPPLPLAPRPAATSAAASTPTQTPAGVGAIDSAAPTPVQVQAAEQQQQQQEQAEGTPAAATPVQLPAVGTPTPGTPPPGTIFVAEENVKNRIRRLTREDRNPSQVIDTLTEFICQMVVGQQEVWELMEGLEQVERGYPRPTGPMNTIPPENLSVELMELHAQNALLQKKVDEQQLVIDKLQDPTSASSLVVQQQAAAISGKGTLLGTLGSTPPPLQPQPQPQAEPQQLEATTPPAQHLSDIAADFERIRTEVSPVVRHTPNLSEIPAPEAVSVAAASPSSAALALDPDASWAQRMSRIQQRKMLVEQMLKDLPTSRAGSTSATATAASHSPPYGGVHHPQAQYAHSTSPSSTAHRMMAPAP